jgi:uncharacterized membrane protein
MTADSKNDNKIINDHLEIEKLLNRFRSTRAIVEIEVLGKTYEGNIHSVSDVTLSIHYKGVMPSTASSLTLNVTSGHTIYTFNTSILDIQDSEAVISTPTEIKTLVKRKYKRVKIDQSKEASIEFTIATDSMPQADSGKVVPKYAQIYAELSKKVPNVKNIVQLIMQHLQSYADDSSIVLYKKDEKFPLPVQIIKELNETLYIKNIRDRSSYLSNVIPKVISLGTYLKHLKEKGKDDKEIKETMVRMINEDQQRGVRSYIYSPISLFGEVIGHIYVANVKSEFSDQNVYITISMAEVISEAFVKTKLFQLKSAGSIKAEIINLSAGGALLEINDQYVMKFIRPNTKLNITLNLTDVSGKEHVFNCGSKVLRVINNEGKNRVAIKFQELRWNEQDAIDKAVRKKIEFQQALNEKK